MDIPTILLTAIVSLPHITVTSSKVIWAPTLLLHIARRAVLLVKQNAFVGAAMQLLTLWHKHTAALSSAQSTHSNLKRQRKVAAR